MKREIKRNLGIVLGGIVVLGLLLGLGLMVKKAFAASQPWGFVPAPKVFAASQPWG